MPSPSSAKKKRRNGQHAGEHHPRRAAAQAFQGMARNIGQTVTGAKMGMARRRRKGQLVDEQQQIAAVVVSAQEDKENCTKRDVSEQSTKATNGQEMSNVSSDLEKSPERIVLGSWVENLTEDSSLILISSLLVAVYPTFTAQERIVNNQIPLSVALCWVFVAFAAGQVVSVRRSNQADTQSSVDHPEPDLISETPEAKEQQRCSSNRVETRRPGSHKLLRRILGPMRSSKINFGDLTRPVSEAWKKSAWTNLSLSVEARRSWLRKCDPTCDCWNNSLMNTLLRNSHYRRTRKSAVLGDAAIEELQQLAEQEETPSSTEIGSFELASADSLNDFVVKPLFQLRGMDIFVTSDAPETSVADHPFLVQHGLRDVPTFIVNAITQWGNILIYFELPKWVQDWDSILEDDDDPDEVKALKVGHAIQVAMRLASTTMQVLIALYILFFLSCHNMFSLFYMKRFFNGSDEYRNARMKLIPSLVEGPLAVRVLAPPKKEKVVDCAFLSVSWAKHAPTVVNGKRLHTAITCELDCLSTRVIRGMAGIVKKHLSSLAIDVAVTISKPDGQVEDEPQACLGLWRFDHIDVDSCPELPDRHEIEAKNQGQSSDVFRASKIMEQLSTAETRSL